MKPGEPNKFLTQSMLPSPPLDVSARDLLLAFACNDRSTKDSDQVDFRKVEIWAAPVVSCHSRPSRASQLSWDSGKTAKKQSY
jgi:hypothetical protein